ncbi:cystathionine beta-lyase [Actinokineospora baliensis]|nr:cystathionine beta-lyase [Actinokineospora baliensis]
MNDAGPAFTPLSAAETAPGALGMWLAEMGLPGAECVRQAIRGYADGTLSYPVGFDFATDSLRRWLRHRHRWSVGADQVHWYSGAVHAIAATVLATTDPGDTVVVMTPAYPPMLRAVGELGRRLVRWPLGPDGQVDAAALARLVELRRPPLVVLTSPHNPTGRVFSGAELRAVAEVVRAGSAFVLSDEVFADVVFTGSRHTPFAAACPETADRVVSVVSASKAFNLAGLRCAAAVAGAEAAQRLATVAPALTGTTSVVAALAASAAWDHGEPWLTETLRQLSANRERLFTALGTEIPLLAGTPPEGTYLAWLAAAGPLAATGDVQAALVDAGVDLAGGQPFGGSPARVRMCFACAPEVLETAISRLSRVNAAALRAGRSRTSATSG